MNKFVKLSVFAFLSSVLSASAGAASIESFNVYLDHFRPLTFPERYFMKPFPCNKEFITWEVDSFSGVDEIEVFRNDRLLLQDSVGLYADKEFRGYGPGVLHPGIAYQYLFKLWKREQDGSRSLIDSMSAPGVTPSKCNPGSAVTLHVAHVTFPDSGGSIDSSVIPAAIFQDPNSLRAYLNEISYNNFDIQEGITTRRLYVSGYPSEYCEGDPQNDGYYHGSSQCNWEALRNDILTSIDLNYPGLLNLAENERLMIIIDGIRDLNVAYMKEGIFYVSDPEYAYHEYEAGRMLDQHLMAHEFLHTLGLEHTGLIEATETKPDRDQWTARWFGFHYGGILDEYAGFPSVPYQDTSHRITVSRDRIGPMNTFGSLTHISTHQKWLLGWLADNTIHTFTSNLGEEVIRLEARDIPPNGESIKQIRIPLPRDPKLGNASAMMEDQYYFVEYKRCAGFDEEDRVPDVHTSCRNGQRYGLLVYFKSAWSEDPRFLGSYGVDQIRVTPQDFADSGPQHGLLQPGEMLIDSRHGIVISARHLDPGTPIVDPEAPYAEVMIQRIQR